MGDTWTIFLVELRTIEEAEETISQPIQLCMAGGFRLQKWTSNYPGVLQSISSDKHISSVIINIDDNFIVHTLELCWQPNTDMFQFSAKFNITGAITKRTILSNIAKLFDPLGFLSPIIITAKILMQELWTLKLNWDDPLPESIIRK